jgi:pimeloyl-ACP methyl ester carboxylesterase
VPTFTRAHLSIHYEIHGEGFPVLLLAPGGMRSSVGFWQRQPWHPIDALRSEFRLIAMDQRNAGQSRGPVTADDGWHSYTVDQLALLDHLGIERCHVLGGCIGGSFSLGLAERAPERLASLVLQQPIGLSADNRAAFYDLFDGWAEELREGRPEIEPLALARMRERLYGGDFVFNVSREFVASCPLPMLILRGDDLYHPAEISEEIARLAPRAELIRQWKEGASTAIAIERVKAFLAEHTPLAEPMKG